MATDIYGKRKMYSSGGLLLLIIPFGMIIIFLLYDFGINLYTQKRLDKQTEEALYEVLNREGLESLDEARDYVEKLFMEYEIPDDDISLLEFDSEDALLLTVYDRYTSVIGELTFGLVKNKQIMVHSSYKGYYNEFKEAVVEKYNEKEDIDKRIDNSSSDDDEITIN